MSNPKKWWETSLLITLKFQIKKKKMKTKQTFLLQILAIAALTISCNTPNEPVNNSLTLSAEVSCTEAWLKLSANNVSLPKGITITRDGNNLFSFTLTTNDTTLYDSTLTPNKSYTYQAWLSPLGGESNKVVATTLDTTSHNFTWQTYTFGDARVGSSTLYDVSIVNDTLAYAAGEIYLSDSTGESNQTPYCLARWNGKNWHFMRLKFFPPGSGGDSLNAIGSAVFANNKDDIWLSAGTVFHYDGNRWTAYYNMLGAEGATKIWSDGKGNVWFVGRNGLIINYSNGSLHKIESGTSVDIQDIWGTDNEGRQTIMCSASNVASDGEHKILKINGSKVEQVEWVNSRRTHSIWFDDTNSIFSCGGGVYIKKHRIWIEQTSLPLTYTRRVRGNAKNDVFVVGDFGLVGHYNGTNWKTYPEAAQGLFYSMDYKKRIMVAAGGSDKAILLVMKNLK